MRHKKNATVFSHFLFSSQMDSTFVPSTLFFLKLLSLVRVLLLVGVSAVQDPEHLCHKVMTGRFEAIQFRSVTYYGPDRLWLFESERKYVIDRTIELGPDATFLPVARYTVWNDQQMSFVNDPAFLSWTSRELLTPRAIYLLGFADPKKEGVRNFFKKEGIWVALTGDNEESLWDIYKNVVDSPHLTWKSESRIHPDYAIVADQFDDHTEGYVLHQDIYGNTKNFIIYDLVVERSFSFSLHIVSAHLKIHTLNAPAEERATAHYFYLEKSQDPSKVRLVHRSNFKKAQQASGKSASQAERDQEQRQLLSPKTHPVGYKNGPNTFLFDNLLGCVYIIHRMPSSLEAIYKKYEGNVNAAELTLTRTNIPYEDFFRCNVEYFKMVNFEKLHDPRRCETTIFTNPSVGMNKEGSQEEDSFFLVTVFCIIGGFLLFLLITLLLIYCYCLSSPLSHHKKPKESENGWLKWKRHSSPREEKKKRIEKDSANSSTSPSLSSSMSPLFSEVTIAANHDKQEQKVTKSGTAAKTVAASQRKDPPKSHEQLTQTMSEML